MSAERSDARGLERLRSELERSERRTEDLLRHAVEAQRRVEEIRSTRTWRIAQALGSATSLRGLARLPKTALRALTPPPLFELEPVDEAARSWRRPADDADARPCVLVVTSFIGPGGAERVMLDMMQALADDVRFALAYSETSPNDWEERFRDVCSAIERVADVSTLRNFAAEVKPRAVVVSSTGLGYRAAPALEALGAEIFDIIHNTSPEGWLSDSLRHERLIHTHFAVGGAQRDALVAAGVAEGKVVLCPNGVDVEGRFRRESYLPEIEELRARFGVESGDLVVTWVGRLSKEKDPLLFVDTVAGLVKRAGATRVRALMLGDGPLRIDVERAIRQQGLTTTVETLGTRNDVAEALAVTAIFLLPSVIEGSPLSMLEAMSMGCAVVAADVGAVSEVIEDGRNGILLRERTAEAAVEATAQLAASADLRRLGTAARATVAERFNVVDSAAIYRRTLLNALGR